MRTAVIAIMTVLTLSACGGDDGDERAPQPAAQETSPAAEIQLVAEDYVFMPQTVRAEAGETVTMPLRNESSTDHNFTHEEQNVDVDVAPGQETTFEISVPPNTGLRFYCEYHEDQGMQGILQANPQG